MFDSCWNNLFMYNMFMFVLCWNNPLPPVHTWKWFVHAGSRHFILWPQPWPWVCHSKLKVSRLPLLYSFWKALRYFIRIYTAKGSPVNFLLSDLERSHKQPYHLGHLHKNKRPLSNKEIYHLTHIPKRTSTVGVTMVYTPSSMESSF